MQLLKSYDTWNLPPAPPGVPQFPESLLADGVDTATSTVSFINNINGGGSNTAGTIHEIDASTSDDAGGIWFEIGNINGTNLSGRLEFMTGASLSEVTWASAHIGFTLSRAIYVVPGLIPAGTRLSVRAVMHASGSQGYGIHWGLLPLLPADIGAPVMLGNTGSNQRGVTLATPGGTNTKGAWTELEDSTTDDICALMVCAQLNADSTVAAQNILLDIGVGAASAEAVLIGDLYLVTNATGPTLDRRMPMTYQVDIPAGSRVSARFQSDQSGDLIDVCCVGATVA